MLVALFLVVLFLQGASRTWAADSDQWFTIRFNGDPIGYERIRIREIEFDGRLLLSCYRKTQMNFERLGQNLSVRASLWTRQADDGTLHYFNLQRVDGAGARIERTGHWDGKRSVFHINERVAATRREFDMRLSEPARSPLITTWLPQLMKAQRNGMIVPVLFPESAGTANISASRRHNKQIRIDSLKRVDANQFVFSPQLDPAKRTTVYTDMQDSLLLSEQSLLGGTLSIQASSVEKALSESSGRRLNVDLLTPVPTTRLLSSSPDRQKLVIELSVRDGFLPLIPETAFQKVERLNAVTARLTLTIPDLQKRRATPASYSQHPAGKSTRWMPLSDIRLQRMAVTGAAGATNPVEVCQRLERLVQAKMKHSAFSTSLIPADEIVRTLKGDCTEHAVLLAALMRVQGIPSRVVSGLVHTNQQFGFVGHMWVEALISDQWIPFDSSSATSGSNMTHIKLAHSELPDTTVSGIKLFLPLLDLAGQAQVTVVSDR